MENPRPEKVAVVDEVRAKFEASNAAVLDCICSCLACVR